MFEFAGLAVGIGLGFGLDRLGGRAGAALVVAGSLVTGLAISALSGELEVSWGFLVFDVGQVFAAALATAAVQALRRRAGPGTAAAGR